MFLFNRNLNKKTNLYFAHYLSRSKRLSIIFYFDLLKKVNLLILFKIHFEIYFKRLDIKQNFRTVSLTGKYKLHRKYNKQHREYKTKKLRQIINLLQLVFWAFCCCKFINNILKANRLCETLFDGHNREITDVILRQG